VLGSAYVCCLVAFERDRPHAAQERWSMPVRVVDVRESGQVQKYIGAEANVSSI
jgi:hypothetical protein